MTKGRLQNFLQRPFSPQTPEIYTTLLRTTPHAITVVCCLVVKQENWILGHATWNPFGPASSCASSQDGDTFKNNTHLLWKPSRTMEPFWFSWRGDKSLPTASNKQNSLNILLRHRSLSPKFHTHHGYEIHPLLQCSVVFTFTSSFTLHLPHHSQSTPPCFQLVSFQLCAAPENEMRSFLLP